ncbi:MAG: DUF2497 domain-containing protein [Alphaproteobacteria bacterium]
MSDGTPETALDTGIGDPSMEDILASIRRIIADDAPEESFSPKEDIVDLRVLASQPEQTSDQDQTLVEAETDEPFAAVDFDDILIMDDDDFSTEDLEIPEAEMFSGDVNVASSAEMLSNDFLNLETSSADAVDIDDADELDEELFSLIDSFGDDSASPETPTLLVDAIEEVQAEAPDLSADDLMFMNLLDTQESDDLEILPLETVAAEPAPDEDLAKQLDDLSAMASTVTETSVQALDDDIDFLLDMDLTIDAPDSAADSALGDALAGLSGHDESNEVLDIVSSSLADLEPGTPEILTEDDIFTSSFESTGDDSLDLGEENDIFSSDVFGTEASEADDGVEALDLDDLTNEIMSIDEEQGDVIDLVASLLDSNVDHTESDALIAADSAVSLEPKEETAALNDDAFAALLNNEDDIAGDVDIDLVKSLMAELTDETLMDEEGEDTIMDDSTPDEAGVMDDILELTMVDESQLSEKLSSDMTAMTMAEAYDTPDTEILDALDTFEKSSEQAMSTDDGVMNVDSSINALLQIAAAAETDASEYEDDVISANDETLETTTVTHESNLNIEEPVEEPLAIDALSFELPRYMSEPKEGIDADVMVEGLDVESLNDDQLVAADNADAEAPNEDVAVGNDVSNSDQIDPISPKVPTLEQEQSDMPKLVAQNGILDEITEAATSEAFASLNQVVEEKTVFAESGPRIGDLVQEALRPMLKEWLDDNLKGIVERAVAKEVKRISSGK